MTARAFVDVAVFDAAGTTLIAELPRRWDVQGSEPLNVPGVGQVSLALDDPIFNRHPTLLAFGNVVKFWVGRGDESGDGGYVHGFRIRNRLRRYVDTGEWSGRIITVTGPTIHNDLDRWIVRHEGATRDDSPETRSFSWASAEDEWYDASDWDDDFDTAHWRDDPPTARKDGQPAGWPDPNAYWLWSNPSTWLFYRTSYTATADQLARIYVTHDETVRVFLNGDLIIDKDAFETGYTEMSDYQFVMADGQEYTIGMMTKTRSSPGADGMDGVLLTLMTVGGDGKPDTVLRHTDAAHWVLHRTMPPPGWRKAQMFKKAIEEAVARGNSWAADLTLDWDGDTDSNGQSWTDSLSRDFRVGMTGLDMQTQLTELGEFDVWLDPDSMTLKTYKMRGTDLTDTVTLEPGLNLLGWAVEETEDIRNLYLVHYDGGWVEVSDSDSIDANGASEAMFTLGSVQDDQTAELIAQAVALTSVTATKRAGAEIAALHDEDTGPTGSLVATAGVVPMLDFATGDIVKALNGDGVLTAHRVMSLTLAEDRDSGELTWDPELDEVDD